MLNHLKLLLLKQISDTAMGIQSLNHSFIQS
ncbi:hypothetical protein CLV58_110160 [Spirosoma oryzae]|uniref:Uncharacterized protein n=1 Tax=Spirosoma oryzae TaxID=1469603 RepID=A0A2T0SWC9_9BACT|nr:hypothetical protein CLV58_110160 [Spirosoma oryzae]